MGNEGQKPGHGDITDRRKINEEHPTTKVTDQSEHSDGGNGGGGKVESMDAEQTETKSKKTEELLVRANEFRDASIKIFVDRAKAKYDEGQAEHGGFLPAEVSFFDIEDEIIDAWHYVQAMKSKVFMLCKPQRDVLFHRRTKSVDKQTEQD